MSLKNIFVYLFFAFLALASCENNFLESNNNNNTTSSLQYFSENIISKEYFLDTITDSIKNVNYDQGDYVTPKNIKYKGITFVGDRYCPDVSFDSEDARKSLDKLKLTGANSVAIVVTEYQDYANSSNGIYPIYSNFPHDDYYLYITETEDAIKSIIEYAHKIGISVLLKPHIDVSKENNFNIWRGMIGQSFSQKEWDNWFVHYEAFILKYAKLAALTNSEMFSVSCELIAASHQTNHWRSVIKKIREVYKGILTDSANWGGEEESKEWWDDVDIIGVDAYYINMKTTTNSRLVYRTESDLESVTQVLKSLHEKFNKPVLITEIGFCSGNCLRNEQINGYDQYLQAYYYEKVFTILAKQEFIVGFYWWSWNTDPNFGGLNDQCISPQHKPAEQVLRKIYQGDKNSFSLIPEGKPKCICTV
jgi:hypothetical protein